MRARRWHLQDLTDCKSARRGIDHVAPPSLSFRPDAFRKPASTFRNHALSLASMRTQDLITEKLRKAFTPESLHVEDESHRHEGHAGHRPGGETHFRLYIVSEAFRGKSRL